MPFFIAFYSILVSATELWGGHFLWIKDLSQADCLFMIGFIRFDLLLLLMAASQFWQGYLTPSPDPQQRTMALMMPLVMTVMMYFWSLSAALILYWTVSNLFTIVQTYLTHKPTKREMTPVKPGKHK